MTKKKSKKKTPIHLRKTKSGRYAKILFDQEPHCRPCAQEKIKSGSLAQGGGVVRIKKHWVLKSHSQKKDADGPAIFCKKCGKHTHHDQWTGELVEEATGSANIRPLLEKRIHSVLGPKDAFGRSITDVTMVEHKSPHQRWPTGDQPNNIDMSEDEIKATFQLYPNEHWNKMKSKQGCEPCIKSKGKKGRDPPYEGGWPEDTPETGPNSVEGCKGCFWYDTAEYLRKNLGDET